jgi:hypothetical protein
MTVPTKTRISVGDTVIVNLGSERVQAEVLEDRGRLGADGVRVLRVGWTPSDTDERLEFEVPEGDIVVRAVPQLERVRALARIDEFSVRPPLVGIKPKDALAKLSEARILLDRAVSAAQDRGEPKDLELVHRYCVEELGPTALHARRLWTDATEVSHVNPTLHRLPALVDEAAPSRKWITARDPLSAWHELVSQELDRLSEMSISDRETGSGLMRVVGYCAEMAAWIRTAYGVGD